MVGKKRLVNTYMSVRAEEVEERKIELKKRKRRTNNKNIGSVPVTHKEDAELTVAKCFFSLFLCVLGAWNFRQCLFDCCIHIV